MQYKINENEYTANFTLLDETDDVDKDILWKLLAVEKDEKMQYMISHYSTYRNIVIKIVLWLKYCDNIILWGLPPLFHGEI